MYVHVYVYILVYMLVHQALPEDNNLTQAFNFNLPESFNFLCLN